MERGKQPRQMEEGKVQAKAGVKDCSSVQILRFSVTRAQRVDSGVGTRL